MDRREVLSRLALIVGGTIVGAEAFLTGCSPADKSSHTALNNSQILLLNEFGEVIIPKTPESDGAKAANIGEFMNTIVTEYYNADERTEFLKGIERLKQSSFIDLSDSERSSFIINLEGEAKLNENHFYLMIKQLTIWGYMTSEVGMTQMFNFAPVPGFYDEGLNYKPGDKVMNPRVANWEARNFATFHSKT